MAGNLFYWSVVRLAESTLLVCSGKSKSPPLKLERKPETTPIPRSEVLGKVKNFLDVISEANKKLQEEAKDKSSEDLDIEVLTGNESQYIEMDLMLGVTDLHTPEAVAAAESAISGYQPVISFSDEDDSSDTESEDSSDEDSDVEAKLVNSKAKTSQELSESKSGKSKKRPRILELP
uniref:Uncharacterized protein n=1 Tax=Kalanchoe fedtschenkoi TaxID=63787 RepID=A0A7N0SZE6_KALFE